MQKILDSASYGTLAVCKDNIPYSLPLNFVYLDGCFYFHGSKKGKKIDYIKANANASFSIVNEGSLIPSYFSSDSGLACPATQFFSSIIANGVVEFVEDYNQKVNALEALMQKLQKEGKYKALSNTIYKGAIDATTIYKLVVKEFTIKDKYGQKLPKERIKLIVNSLEKRATKQDLETIKRIKELRDDI